MVVLLFVHMCVCACVLCTGLTACTYTTGQVPYRGMMLTYLGTYKEPVALRKMTVPNAGTSSIPPPYWTYGDQKSGMRRPRLTNKERHPPPAPCSLLLAPCARRGGGSCLSTVALPKAKGHVPMGFLCGEAPGPVASKVLSCLSLHTDTLLHALSSSPAVAPSHPACF